MSEKNENILEDLKIDESTVNPFRYKKFNDKYLITNDFGFYYFLEPFQFKKYIEGELSRSSELFSNLVKYGFIKNEKNKSYLYSRIANKNSRLKTGPGLHIVVVTLRCNYNCIYCQASSKGMEKKELDMDVETAKKVVDRVFETTSKNITIEFQGGEPMVNWKVVKFIINYARGKESTTDKKVKFSLVTNLSLMNEKRFRFLTNNGVNICTSLDGPKELQNKNRPFPKGDSYQPIKKWINKSNNYNGVNKISALLTVSKFALDKPKEIIDEYRSFGYSHVHLRPLSNLGQSAGDAKNQIGYSPKKFMDYWRESMDYILDLNKKGELFVERGSKIMLTKILTNRDPGFTDLASPCGAVLGQVVYNYNGDLYTCDEGRMLEEDVFKLGNIDNISYEEMVNSDICKTMIDASILENQPCDLCVYKPYCGVCPVKNYAAEGTLFPNIQNTEWCKLKKSQLNYLFSKLEDEEYERIFKNWVKKRKH
ncbi:MAG: His-Xaa-Ser system radical SAM maturase HxsB [Candidatus Woesearchaeota archaeon]